MALQVEHVTDLIDSPFNLIVENEPHQQVLHLGEAGLAGPANFAMLGPFLAPELDHPDWTGARLREAFEQEVTLNASDAKRLGVKTGDTVEVFNARGRCVVPVYVTERCMPGVAVLHEGAWMDIDENGVDRAGNPDFLTLDEPSPAGAFAYNTVLVDIKKSDLEHRPGWDRLATSRSHVFRRDS